LLSPLFWSVFGNCFPGSTDDLPVPSGDAPDGTETTVRGNENGLFARWLGEVQVGGSPTGAGESHALPPNQNTLLERSSLKHSRGQVCVVTTFPCPESQVMAVQLIVFCWYANVGTRKVGFPTLHGPREMHVGVRTVATPGGHNAQRPGEERNSIT